MPVKSIKQNFILRFTHPRGIPAEAMKGKMEKPLILRVDGNKLLRNAENEYPPNYKLGISIKVYMK